MGLPIMPGNVLTGNGWWQTVDPMKMEAEPDEAPEWAVLHTGQWMKPKHWQWAPKEWCYRCTMCNKLTKNEGHVESDMHLKALRNRRFDTSTIKRVVQNLNYNYENPWQITESDDSGRRMDVEDVEDVENDDENDDATVPMVPVAGPPPGLPLPAVEEIKTEMEEFKKEMTALRDEVVTEVRALREEVAQLAALVRDLNPEAAALMSSGASRLGRSTSAAALRAAVAGAPISA